MVLRVRPVAAAVSPGSAATCPATSVHSPDSLVTGAAARLPGVALPGEPGVGRPDGAAAVRPGDGAAARLAGRLGRPVAAVPDWDGVVPLKTPVAAARATPAPPSAATTPSDRKPRCRASRDLPDLVRPDWSGCSWPVAGDGAS